MKKLFLIMLGCTFLLCGCGKKIDINKTSKDLNTYTLDITLNDDMTLDGQETLAYKNRTNSDLDHLCFHLYPKAFKEGAVNKPVSTLNEPSAYPNGLSFGDITINAVKVNDKEAQFALEGTDENILNVTLDKTIVPGESTKVYIDFEVQLPNINHRFGYGDNTVNIANFYPIVAVHENGDFVLNPYNSNGDPFYSDMSNYNVKLTLQDDYIIASTGTVNNKTNNNGLNTYEMSAIVVRDFAIVASKKFEALSSESNGVKVNYYYYDDDNASQNLETAIKAVDTFGDLFGKYPYSVLSVVKTGFVHGGMEYPNLVYISDAVNSLEDYQNVIVHEIAHQWWYQVIGSDAFRYAWLDEGLTEFSTIMFYEQHPEYGVNTQALINNLTTSFSNFVNLYEDIIGQVDTSMNRAIDEYNTETEYVYMTYVKGNLLFADLRALVGTKNFNKSLQNYFETYKFQNVTPDHLIGIFEKTCKRKLKSFFSSYLEGKVVIQNAA